MTDTTRRDGGQRPRRDSDPGAAEPAPDRSTGVLDPDRASPDTVEERSEDILVAEAGGDVSSVGLWGDAWRNLRRNPLFVIGAVLLVVLSAMAVAPQLFTSVDPRSCDLTNSADPPSASAWFGYDIQGCDYYSNVIYGARVSMAIGLLVVGGALTIALVLGSVAGYAGGFVDGLIARVADIVYGLPLILGAILVLNAFESRGLLQVSLALVVLTWMTPLRLLRSSVIGIKQSDYVQAARALGAGSRRIVIRHILPNALAPVLVYATISVGVIIAAEATLSFLGVGLQLPEISWGLMINSAQNRIISAPHLLLFPGLFLSATVLAFILIGDSLRDALDPKLR